jgi:hypothetical protein
MIRATHKTNEKGERKWGKNSVKPALSAAIVLCAISAVQAAPVTYQFNASNFTSDRGSLAPVSSVAGSFTLDGETLVGLDLTVGTHVFTLGQVGYQVYLPYSAYIGATAAGGYNRMEWSWSSVDPVGTSYNDFRLDASLNGYLSSSFAYTVANIGDRFEAQAVTVWDPSVVPVPTAAWLFGSGLVGLAGFARRRKDVAPVD